jgi:hypothetical protein
MQLSQIATGLLQACQQVVTMLLFHQVATRLSLTTYWQIVGLQDDNKLLEKLNNLVASCQQAVDNLSTSWEQAVLTHPVDKLLEQHCYKSDNINKVVTKFTWCFRKQNYYILSPCKHTKNLLRLLRVVNSLFRTCWSQLGINKQYEHNLLTACWQTCYKMWDFSVCSRVAMPHARISHLVASLPTSRQQVVFALLVPSCQQVWNKL